MRRLVPGAHDGWSAAGVDEFLRSYYTPRGRAAFYAAARNIYLDAPLGDDGFWSRLADLEPDSLFVWGREDTLVPIGFRRHVEDEAGGGVPPGAGLRPRAPGRGAGPGARRDAPVPGRAAAGRPRARAHRRRGLNRHERNRRIGRTVDLDT